MTERTDRLALPLPGFVRSTPLELGPVRLAALGVLASLAYSGVRLACDPLINPDAVYYLVAAETWMREGLDMALGIYWRPFYSILIGSLAMVSGLSTLASAHIIDALLAASLLVAVQLLTREFGGGVKAQAVAVVLLLLWPSLNEFRILIVRDFGYWTASLMGLVALIRFARDGSAVSAGLFQASVLVAMLFRPEAVALLLLPFTLLIGPRRGRLYVLLVAFLPLLTVGSLLALGAVFSERIAEFVTGLTNESLREPLKLIDSLPERLEEMRNAFADRVLNLDFNDYATIGLIVGVVAIVLSHLLAAMSFPVVLVSALGLRRASLAPLDRYAVRLGFALVVVVFTMLCVFLVIRPIMQTRFLILPALIFVALAPFAVVHVRERAMAAGRYKQYRWGAALVLVYLVGEAGFSLTQSKGYILDAVQLVEQRTAADSRVLSNDARITYLSGRQYVWRDLIDARLLHGMSAARRARLARDYDYWVVHLHGRDAGRGALESATQGWVEIGRTSNVKGDQVVLLVTPGEAGAPPAVQ